MRVVLGVAGGIAAYKACSLLRLFAEAGHEVTVVPTAAALHFVGEATWAALSGRPVHTDVWDDVHEVPHVRLGQQADLVIVAPATADLLARAAHGMANDLLTNILLTARCPVVLAPAMHTEMWLHAATQANVATLRSRGVVVIEPADGRLTGKDTGPGRLPEPPELYDACRRVLADSSAGAPRSEVDVLPEGAANDLAGLRIVVSAGGTQEPIDPVRFIGNRSSGKMGMALAEVAARRGALVTVVAANLTVPSTGAALQHLTMLAAPTALQMQQAVSQAAREADVVVMAAAVADFRPAHVATAKIKKSHDGAHDESAPTIELVRNPDILAGLVRERGAAGAPLIVGFAAETGDADGSVIDHARTKLARKGCDLLVANEVGVGVTFGQDVSTAHLLRPDSDKVLTVGPAPKEEIAEAIWDAVAALLRGGDPAEG
jgi:phosphopantothenoylcysteine decarboxylase/phosphopantothenate--cysteine ligase